MPSFTQQPGRCAGPGGWTDEWTDRCPGCCLGRDHRSLCLSLLFADNGYRQCLANGSWAARVNYSECQEILSEEVRLPAWRGASGPPARVHACHVAGSRWPMASQGPGARG